MLHWSCENCTQIHHRLKCTSKMTRLAPWSCSTWVLSATELKKEQSIFCSCQGICKIQPSISSTHFSQRQKLLHSFELTFIRPEVIWQQCFTPSQAPCTNTCTHMHKRGQVSFLSYTFISQAWASALPTCIHTQASINLSSSEAYPNNNNLI